MVFAKTSRKVRPDFETLRKETYTLAKTGQRKRLNQAMEKMKKYERTKIIAKPCADPDGHFCPPLVIACRLGHLDVARELVLSYKAKVEITGRVKFGGYVIDGATPLWCAAATGNKEMVEFLLAAGAKANKTTAAKSTPLRGACFGGHLDVAKILVDTGKANPHAANDVGSTNVMIAAYKGYKDILQYLLELGVNANKTMADGTTALHLAAEFGKLEVIKELVEKGRAKTTAKDSQNLMPIHIAALKCEEECFEYLMHNSQEIKGEDKVNAYELLGASFANEKKKYCLDKSNFKA